ncbi:hypothetical protein ETU08_11000 [Apibacter muscae]|uniref:DUF4476 domain-containing protein n=1 Tax=Apibacter muscae TaxID=2509004 RepID=A0A563D8T8_9FLAO|nr:hypothetical protein [Apibacter muscae]TWP22734.1 hypothetical protein ETU10_09050 [Apibacter muscae]TWP26656.1 hypothetical protein ETU09_08820 [Apibacter muscae]TWP28229.1 hypothetical protein ETU08_11000 [Apibacter muscae]
MKKNYLWLLLILFFQLNAQQIDSLSIANPLYSEYKSLSFIPTYKFSKISKLLAKSGIKNISNNGSENKIVPVILSDEDFNQLSFKEKFTYVMAYPENLNKNIILNTSLDRNDKINAHLPYHDQDIIWSIREIDFLRNNRNEVLKLIKENSLKQPNIGLNFKLILRELNATEMIPFLISSFKKSDKKDYEILTLLMLLVKDNNYFPFMKSNICYHLYIQNKDSNEMYLDILESNVGYILSTAKNYYSQLPKPNKTL